MCVPGTFVRRPVNRGRRDFLRLSMAAAAGALGGSAGGPRRAVAQPRTLGTGRVVDLTYPLTTDFPSFDGDQRLFVESATTREVDGYYTNWLRIFEHIGTHIDAPCHFADEGVSVDAIPPEDLVLGAVVVDIRERAADDPDLRLTPDDLRAWEQEHGPIPSRSLVLMLSGWGARIGDAARFRNADEAGTMHFPGFHVEAVQYLLEERDVRGIGVDTLSLDHGPSADFAVHNVWLGAQRWGIENVANLDQLPATGATVVVGAPTVVGASGGPSRVLALL